ncbi:MAG TPA: 1,2-phenylacetyl-CoA epoxidase subunit PaaD [Chthoniobacterales bacterium]
MNTSLPSLEEIWAWLDSVSDPEIPILSVVDLGIVRNVRWIEENPDFTTEQTSPRVNETSVIDGGLRRPRAQRTRRSEPTLLVTVTPTYSGCPAMAVIKNDIQRALHQRGIDRVRLDTQLSPAWTTDWMTERGRKRLREYGIAPPAPCEHGHTPNTERSGKAGPNAERQTTLVPCPRCGSSDTRLVSRFGSTPCKAFYICNSCLEPFDHFKCH